MTVENADSLGHVLIEEARKSLSGEVSALGLGGVTRRVLPVRRVPSPQECQEKLSQLLHANSQWYFCAGWVVDWGYRAWACVVGETKAAGLGSFEMSPEHVQELREGADRAAGWFHWPPIPEGGDVDDAPLEPVFIEMAEWEELYAQWKAVKAKT